MQGHLVIPGRSGNRLRHGRAIGTHGDEFVPPGDERTEDEAAILTGLRIQSGWDSRLERAHPSVGGHPERIEYLTADVETSLNLKVKRNRASAGWDRHDGTHGSDEARIEGSGSIARWSCTDAPGSRRDAGEGVVPGVVGHGLVDP